ncbi:histidinol dehydrogenase [Apibacter muscae]|uniref:Histidinol dehydrogenase n=1 Tax=Apibacter muscae TaxID=2509004 RepID=A0A563DEL7_9FLAO|nr:histidinol dehydrogenase [Apibacter muscae]TWP28676.1 histidinol dehydrogenase [Apibacter muscae]TWP30075.1 histidinol dehydrogenase [Apibacter muscae]
MKTIKYPAKSDWQDLILRPEREKESLLDTVKSVFNDIKISGDSALKLYTEKFDNVNLTQLKVSKEEIDDSTNKISMALQEAIVRAKNNIEKFHSSQKEHPKLIDIEPGVICWRESRPIEKVGLYIPGGTAPLFSTVLMLGIPAKLAGCKEIILCTPPDSEGDIHPAILFAAKTVGITEIYKVGGIQAIAALSLGTESIPAVYKIFGPGNQYVTAAKKYAQEFNISIDLPAGPSEVLIIADEQANPSFVAADLLSQAEHGTDSQVIFLTTDEAILEKTLKEIENQLKQLPRKEIAAKALDHSTAILFNSIDECIQFSNQYAPEHLILAIKDFVNYVNKIENAGSVFLGNYSCESAGDYASGTNHTLPTNGYARNYSGVSLDSFVKKITFQELTQEGIQNLGPTIELMAEAEELLGHKNAVSLRLK